MRAGCKYEDAREVRINESVADDVNCLRPAVEGGNNVRRSPDF